MTSKIFRIQIDSIYGWGVGGAVRFYDCDKEHLFSRKRIFLSPSMSLFGLPFTLEPAGSSAS